MSECEGGGEEEGGCFVLQNFNAYQMMDDSGVQKMFRSCLEWEHSGDAVNTLRKVSDLEIITTHIPGDPEKVQRVMEQWMSNQKEYILKRIYVWMGAEVWEEKVDFSISTRAGVQQTGCLWTGHWKDGVWDLGMSRD
jgi:hypothetical protein